VSNSFHAGNMIHIGGVVVWLFLCVKELLAFDTLNSWGNHPGAQQSMHP
jgi:hypothetical protein